MDAEKEKALLHTIQSLIEIIDGVLAQRNTISNKDFTRIEDSISELKASLPSVIK